MSELPPELDQLVEELLRRASLEESSAREVRSDLRQHLIDGLSRGRSVDELVERFGDPEVVAPILTRAPAPRARFAPGRGFGFIASLLTDLRHAIRSLLKSPSMTATVLVVLAIGIAANAVVFSVMNELLLRPLPVAEPEGLVDVWADIEGGNSFLGVSWPDVERYRADNDVLEELVAFSPMSFELGEGGPLVSAQLTSPGYFEMLGLAPTLGSLSLDGSGAFGDAPVAILSHALWLDGFGGDPEIVGETIRLRDVAVTVTGVGPERFSGHFTGFPTEIWIPVFSAPQLVATFDPTDRAQQSFELIGRLKAGVSAPAAQEALNAIGAELERAHPGTNQGHRLGVTPTTGLDHSLHAAVTAFVLILTAIAILVLVVACLNVGSVLLVRAMSRERELAVRIALGAGRRRVLRLVLTESVFLAAIGSLLGLLAAWQLNEVLGAAFTQAAPGLGLDLAIDARVIGLTALAAATAVGIAAAAPAMHVLGKHPAGVLRARGGVARGGARLRSILVVGQVSVSAVLVVATGLFVRALVEGGRVDFGLDVDRVASFPIGLPREESDRHAQIERDLLAALGDVPGVEAVAVGSTPPIGVARSPLGIEVPGVEPPSGFDQHLVDHRFVSPGYLGVLGIQLVTGREFRAEDEETRDRVAVVSEAFHATYWPREPAVGKSFLLEGEVVRVVGVASDARYIVQDDSPDPLVYLSRREVAPAASIVVRGIELEEKRLELEAAIDGVIPGLPALRFLSGREVIDRALLPQRMAVYLVGAMGLVALFLSAVGLYGLIQYTVSRDTHELGVRLALGGDQLDLAAVVVRKGFRLAGIGTALGVGIALLTMPGLGGFLGNVSPGDPLTYGVVIACFVAVSGIASWIPARRALRIEAITALKGE